MGAFYLETLYNPSYSASAIQTLPFYKDALEGAGWVVDRYDVGSRLHAHFGSAHIDIVAYDAPRLQACYCTGYDGGAAWNAQPGTSPAVRWYSRLYNTSDWIRIHVLDARIYVQTRYNNGSVNATMYFGKITEKVGTWNGGELICGSDNASTPVLGASPSMGYVFLEGSWQSGLYGTHVNTPLMLRPIQFTGASFLCPILMLKNNTGDASLKHPLGYLSGMYQANPAYFYADQETILIAEIPYRWMGTAGWWVLCKEG